MQIELQHVQVALQAVTSFAIAGGLLFTAIQFRQARQSQNVANFEKLVELQFQLRQLRVVNPSLARVHSADVEHLHSDEEIQEYFLNLMQLSLFEIAWYAHREGQPDDDYFNSWTSRISQLGRERSFQDMMANPAMKIMHDDFAVSPDLDQPARGPQALSAYMEVLIDNPRARAAQRHAYLRAPYSPRVIMSDEVTRQALTNVFAELVEGPDKPGSAFVLNTGDAGLLRSLDKLSAEDVSRRSHDGATIAAHAQHLRFGLSLMNQWAREGGNPFANAKWDEAWKISEVDNTEWDDIRGGLTEESRQWLESLGAERQTNVVELGGMIGSIAHLAYHLGAIRQTSKTARGPKEGTFK